MSINFRGSNRDEITILRSELNSNKLEVRRKAVKKVSQNSLLHHLSVVLTIRIFTIGYRCHDGR